MPKIAKVTKRVQATLIIEGLTKHFTKRNTYWVGGKQYTQRQLIDLFRSQIEAIDEVDAAHAAVASAVARERAVALRIRELARQLKHTLVMDFGFSITGWADFGLELPKKPGPKTVKAKAEGARKAQATRQARHTMGKRQRKKVRGW